MKNAAAIPELEVKCEACNGSGSTYQPEADQYDDCSKCNGSGFMPTAIGARILTLLRHQCRVTVTSEFSVPAVR